MYRPYSSWWTEKQSHEHATIAEAEAEARELIAKNCRGFTANEIKRLIDPDAAQGDDVVLITDTEAEERGEAVNYVAILSIPEELGLIEEE